MKFLVYFCCVKRYCRHIALWVCLPSLLVSTSGFSFHTLYCLCKGETQVSLFSIADPCASVEEKMLGACCAKNKVCEKPVVTIEADGEHQHDCTERGFLFAKLDTPFLSSAGDHPVKSILPLISLPPSVLLFSTSPVLKQEDFLLPPQHAPPPPSGMELRRFLKSYRC